MIPQKALGREIWVVRDKYDVLQMCLCTMVEMASNVFNLKHPELKHNPLFMLLNEDDIRIGMIAEGDIGDKDADIICDYDKTTALELMRSKVGEGISRAYHELAIYESKIRQINKALME